MASTQRVPFVHRWPRAGIASMQPFVARHARMHGFLFEGRRDAVRQLCARYLDRTAYGGPDYEPLGHFVLVTFTQIDGVAAMYDPFKRFGLNPEREVTVWVPVRQRGTLRPAMFTPYCLLDNPLAIQHGREIYGFPKEFARFPQWEDDGFQVEAYAFKRFAPESVGHIQPVMSVDRTGEPLIDLQLPIFDDVLKLVRAIRPELDLLPDWLWPPHGPVVFPKQLPDVDQGGMAAYSALVQAPITLTGLHHVHHLPGQYTLRLPGVDSHPIEQDLGLADGEEAIIDFYADFDFTLGDGEVLWSADGRQ